MQYNNTLCHRTPDNAIRIRITRFDYVTTSSSRHFFLSFFLPFFFFFFFLFCCFTLRETLRHYLRAQSQGHHTIDCLEERDVERGSVRRSSFKERERAIISQTNIGTVSKATLGKLLRDGVERIIIRDFRRA